MRILIGGIIQESNTFSPVNSTIGQFEDHFLLIGEQVRQLENSLNEIGGFYKAAKEKNAELVPTLFANAVSSGKITRAALHYLIEGFALKMKNEQNIDGVLFALHGAMVAEDCDDVEGEILAEIRRCVGPDVPVVISLDLHANVTEEIISHVQGLVAFRTFPHVDYLETGYKAARLLFTIIEGRRKPYVILQKIPMIVPAENMQTTRGPMMKLIQEAEKGEKQGNSLVTSVFSVQPWLDVEGLGWSIVVVSFELDKAVKEAERLARLVWSLRYEFQIQLHSVRQVIEFALANERKGPIVISDSADSPGAGATGDSNAVLKQLLELGAHRQLTCLLSIVDAGAVSQAIAAGVGNEIDLTVGYSLNSAMGKPFEFRGYIVKIGDGKFLFGKGHAPNTQGNMGRCVVMRKDKLFILISEKPVFTGDPEMYRSMGLEPLQADVVLVKSASQFRAAYEEISSHIFILDTPGVSTANLSSLVFVKPARPLFPFDDHFDINFSHFQTIGV